MSFDPTKIFVVIPAFNEQKHIAGVIKELLKYNYKIVVVDDCSSDNTFQVAKSFPVYVLRHKINRGQGAALQTGTDFAVKNNAGIIVHFDGDGQFLAPEIEKMIQPIINNKADITLGSRFLQKKGNMPFLKKYLIHPVSRIINYFLTNIRLTDVHCGFRAFKAEVANKIRLSQDGMAHNTEYLSLIKKNNLTFTEVPVTVIYNEFGQGALGGLKILKELLMGELTK